LILSPQQNDSLSELINISFSRAASSLSDLTGRRVHVTAPEVELHPASDLPVFLRRFVTEDVATVHQIFTGPVGGDVFLLFEHSAAATLAGLMTENMPQEQKLDASLAEALTEVGNILLNACLGMFGNLLEVRVTFSVPRLHLETLTDLLRSMKVGTGQLEEMRYSVVASTSFTIEKTAVKGFLVIVLNVTSLEKLLEALKKLG
jgi:chemotaxis protein CheC